MICSDLHAIHSNASVSHYDTLKINWGGSANVESLCSSIDFYQKYSKN